MSMTAQDSSDPTMSEINVTPLVDVMLVLLIIFMVTAPLMQQGVEVDLPKTQAAPLDEVNDKTLVLSLTKDKKVFIGKVEVPYAELEDKLRFNERIKQKKEIYMEADRTLPYGFVVDVMAIMKRAGVEQLGMLTESPPLEEKEEK
ncbi:MAG: protein TolR [Deltaproteobacteria bacterium]|nr:protein TolR [Deltaproteobacteria bacterium]